MTPDFQNAGRSPRSPRPAARHWYQKRAAVTTSVAIAVFMVTASALGIARLAADRTQRFTTEPGSGTRSNGSAEASPRPAHTTSKGTTAPTAPTAGASEPPAPGQPSTSTTTGSASGRSGSAGGGSVPGASLSLGGRTAFGTSLDLANGGGFEQALSTQDRRFGDLGIVRVFYPGFPAPWNSKPQLATRSSIVSFKIAPVQVLSGSYDSRLLRWFQTAPRSANIYWTYWHEPENDSQLDPAQYRAAWQRISALSRQASNPRLRATLILMGYTVQRGSGRDWRDWYPGSADIDVMGWDVYNTGAKKDKYNDPATLFGSVAAVARSVGKPWGIGETGSRLIPGDNGSQRAAWLREAARYLDSAGALWAAYWDANGRGGSFKLTDAPSIAAWRAAVSS